MPRQYDPVTVNYHDLGIKKKTTTEERFIMYSIQLLRRGGDSPIWEDYFIDKVILVDDPNGATNEDGTPVQIEETKHVRFETNKIDDLDFEVEKLLDIYPKSQIRPIDDLTFTVDALINRALVP